LLRSALRIPRSLPSPRQCTCSCFLPPEMLLRRCGLGKRPLRAEMRALGRHVTANRTLACTPRPPPGQEEPPQGDDEASLRRQLLDAALLAVPEHGWSVSALSAGAVACGLSPAAHGMVPGGPIELVRYFSRACDASLEAELAAQQETVEALEVQNRLIHAMQTRLQMLEPHVGTWSQAMALRMLPVNLPETLTDAHALSSTLLRACGDQATSPLAPPLIDSHLKLLSIGGIYGATELYMLTDRSPRLHDTWLFLEREVTTLHQLAGASSKLHTLSPANLVLSMLRK